MSTTYNGTAILNMLYGPNETSMTLATYNGNTVFQRNLITIIADKLHYDSGWSNAQPPYNAQGYNTTTLPPEKLVLNSVSLGDVTNYNKIKFTWDNEGSLNSYGEIEGYVIFRGTRRNLFDGIEQHGTVEIDITGITGQQTLDVWLRAKSLSAYSGYVSDATVNIYNLSLYAGVQPEPAPEVIPDSAFTVNSGISSVPGPFDSNGYHYDTPCPEMVQTHAFTVDVTSISTLYLRWNNTGTYNDVGIIYGGYSIGGAYTELFSSALPLSGLATIDVSSLTGTLTLTVKALAQAQTSYGGFQTKTIVNIESIAKS